MTSAALNKIKAKYQITDDDLSSIVAYVVTGNKSWAWRQGVGRESTAKAGSVGVIAARYFGDDNISNVVVNVGGIFSKELGETLGLNEVSTETEKEKEKEVSNNETNPDEVLKAGMSKAETINVLNNLAKRVRDPKQLADITLKITNLMEFQSTTDTSNTPIIYLPQRCNSCEYKPKE